MRIAVTGANGFLGVGVVKHLMDKGAYVIACDRSCDRVSFANECVEGDILQANEPYCY